MLFIASAICFTVLVSFNAIFKPQIKWFSDTCFESANNRIQIKINQLDIDKAEDLERIKTLEKAKTSYLKVKSFLDKNFFD